MHMGNMIRTNYYYPKQMLDRLRVAQKQTGLTISELIRRAVDEYLKGMGL